MNPEERSTVIWPQSNNSNIFIRINCFTFSVLSTSNRSIIEVHRLEIYSNLPASSKEGRPSYWIWATVRWILVRNFSSLCIRISSFSNSSSQTSVASRRSCSIESIIKNDRTCPNLTPYTLWIKSLDCWCKFKLMWSVCRKCRNKMYRNWRKCR